MTTISIIIPVWNGRHLLPACLESLRAERLRDNSRPEIIAVDNGSADGSADWIIANEPEVRLLRHQYNLGFGGGCNRGLRAAQSELLILLNQDAQVYPGWLQALEETFENPRIGIAGCKIFYPDGKTLQHAGAWIEWPMGYGRHFGHGEADADAWDVAKPVEWVTGAAFAIRRATYVATGELDEEFWPGYFEDVDYCLRAKVQGFETWYAPAAMLKHQESTSIGDKLELHRVFNRNRLRFTLKHLPPARWLAEAAPAEQQFIIHSRGQEAAIRQLNLLEAAALAPALLIRYWQADQATVQKIVATLRTLAASHAATLRKTLDDPVAQPAVNPAPPALTTLKEFEFSANRPLAGVLFSGFRRLWYNVAARWAILDLRIQQDRINQQQFEYNHQLQAHMQTLQTYHQQGIEQLQQEIEQLQQQLALSIERSTILAQQVLTLQQQAEKDLA